MSFWSGRPILITGGAGFCGAHLCEHLLPRGADIHVLDRVLPPDSYLRLAGLHEKVHFIHGDILDAGQLNLLMERFEIDTVFHLAAQPIVAISNTRPAETAAINITGTYNLLEAVRTSRCAKRLVFASSGAYYGAVNTVTAIHEDAPPLVAGNIYAPTKVAADLAVRCYAKIYGMQTATCRWMNTYGPGDTNFSRIVPATLRRLMRGEAPLIDGTDGSNVLEMLHVHDMIEAYLAVAERLTPDYEENERIRGEAFNCGGGKPITLREVVMSITRAWNAVTGDSVPEAPVMTGPHVKSVKYLDIAKADELLGWRPRIALGEGLQETIEWFRAHRGAIAGL